MDIKLDLEAAVKEQAGPATAEILALALAQRAKGIAKYGQGAEHAPLRFDEWINHAKEELIDLLVYLLTAAKRHEQSMRDHGNLLRALDDVGVRVIPVLGDGGIVSWRIELPKWTETTKSYGAWLSASGVAALDEDGSISDRITLHPRPLPDRVRVSLVIDEEPYEDVSPVSESNE